ncbi:hypothetical protein MMYC01_208557 [Madurella mycetomatis]|uniref:Uncharacterized protein n=1 Tax=Madurella mycetomatis TaxID=100816 RepID=A0A175VSK4_9PEZI|nr:hypothetical protein MMYC01_208557 [Madurella mycetomatis]
MASIVFNGRFNAHLNEVNDPGFRAVLTDGAVYAYATSGAESTNGGIGFLPHQTGGEVLRVVWLVVVGVACLGFLVAFIQKLPLRLPGVWTIASVEAAADQPFPYLNDLAVPADDLLQRSKLYTYDPVYYYFYGILMKPGILKGVLGLETKPVLRPAKVQGYELSYWGQY